MENMGKHEYMESMYVNTYYVLSIWKTEGFHKHAHKKEKKKTRPTLIFFLPCGKHIFFFMP